MSNPAPLTVMFTALKGIPDIEQREGEVRSLEIMQNALKKLREIAREHQGRVVDVVVEELLMIFATPDGAFDAARQMQETIAQDPKYSDPAMSLSVGIHLGIVYRNERRVFGDSINTAARVKGQAPKGRIIVSAEFQQKLSADKSGTLIPYDRIEVKGKAQPLTLLEVPWEDEDPNKTRIFTSAAAAGYPSEISSSNIQLVITGTEHTLPAANAPVTLGRGLNCDFPIDSPSASRLHCRIEHRRGKFILVDTSTNGTHLCRSDGSTAILKREEAVLTGRGRFALGEEATQGAPYTVDFECD